jgi:hypothetical protein
MCISRVAANEDEISNDTSETIKMRLSTTQEDAQQIASIEYSGITYECPYRDPSPLLQSNILVTFPHILRRHPLSFELICLCGRVPRISTGHDAKLACILLGTSNRVSTSGRGFGCHFAKVIPSVLAELGASLCRFVITSEAQVFSRSVGLGVVGRGI